MDLRKIFEQENIGLHEEHTNYVIEDQIDTNRGLFQTHEKTIFDGQKGPVTHKQVNLIRLDCGHVVGARGSQELLGRYQKCNERYVCFRCGVRCSRCLKLLCTSCIKIYQGSAYCGSCRFLTITKIGSLYSLRKIHEALSTKI